MTWIAVFQIDLVLRTFDLEKNYTGHGNINSSDKHNSWIHELHKPRLKIRILKTGRTRSLPYKMFKNVVGVLIRTNIQNFATSCPLLFLLQFLSYVMYFFKEIVSTAALISIKTVLSFHLYPECKKTPYQMSPKTWVI